MLVTYTCVHGTCVRSVMQLSRWVLWCCSQVCTWTGAVSTTASHCWSLAHLGPSAMSRYIKCLHLLLWLILLLLWLLLLLLLLLLLVLLLLLLLTTTSAGGGSTAATATTTTSTTTAATTTATATGTSTTAITATATRLPSIPQHSLPLLLIPPPQPPPSLLLLLPVLEIYFHFAGSVSNIQPSNNYFCYCSSNVCCHNFWH